MPRSGRPLLLLVLALYFGALGVAWQSDRLVSAWIRLGVPAADVTFADTRAYTTAWECARRGIDVFVANPCDPLRRPLVPPVLPARLDFLGLGESSTVPLALAAIALFLLCVFVVAGPISNRDALVYAAILVSPSLMLGVERANTDLLIFALLTVVLVTIRSPRPWLRAVSLSTLLFAGMLKLYPLFASGMLLRLGRRRGLGYLLAVFVPFGLYAVIQLDDIRLAAEHMTRSTYISWGAGVAPQALGLSGPWAIGAAAAGLVVAVALGLWLGGRWRRFAPEDGIESRRELDAFWIGACVYVGTFLVGNNFDYKLVCLLFTVPQLLRWSRLERPPVPAAGWTLGALVAVLWLGAALPVVPWLSDAWLRAQEVFPFDELLTWFLFVYLLAALWCTRPSWLAEPVAVRLPRVAVREGR